MHTVSPVSNTAFFSLTWPAAMQIYYFWNKRKFLHKTGLDLSCIYRYLLEAPVENTIAAVIFIKFSNL